MKCCGSTDLVLYLGQFQWIFTHLIRYLLPLTVAIYLPTHLSTYLWMCCNTMSKLVTKVMVTDQLTLSLEYPVHTFVVQPPCHLHVGMDAGLRWSAGMQAKNGCFNFKCYSPKDCWLWFQFMLYRNSTWRDLLIPGSVDKYFCTGTVTLHTSSTYLVLATPVYASLETGCWISMLRGGICGRLKWRYLPKGFIRPLWKSRFFFLKIRVGDGASMACEALPMTGNCKSRSPCSPLSKLIVLLMTEGVSERQSKKQNNCWLTDWVSENVWLLVRWCEWFAD